MYLPERRHVGNDAVLLLQAARRQARGHDLVEDHGDAARPGLLAHHLQEPDVARQAAVAALHRLEQDGEQFLAVLGQQRPRALDVVVGRHDVVVGDVHRAAAAHEIEHAAVVAAVEHHDLGGLGPALALGEDAGAGQRHHVALGAGVGEAHQVDRRHAVGDQLGELGLVGVAAAVVPAVVQRAVDGGADHRMRVAVDAGGVFAQHVDVFVAVGVPQAAALAAHDGERERRIVQRRAGVAARHRLARFLVAAEALGIAVGIGLARLDERGLQIRIDQGLIGHVTLLALWREYHTTFSSRIGRPADMRS